ncbi:MAG: glycosyltransferase family 39 protein [Caldilineaceae bacterium]
MTAIELNNRLSRWCQRNYFFLVLGLIILVGLGLHWAQINRLVWSSDEGIHLSAAYLVNQGKEPYSQVSFSQGPLFLELVRWPLKWSTTQGSDVTAVRLVMLSFGALLLFAVAMIARELKNELAGWIAAAILLGTPSFFYFARAVMADGPSIALGTWATWAALRYLHRGKRRWLIGSSLLLGLSLAAKFLTIYALGWIGLVICYRMWVVERRSPLSHRIGASLGHGLLFGGGVLLTVLAIYLWYDLPALLRSAFGMRVAMREAFGSWPANNRDEILEFWRYHAPLVLLAAYGLLANLRKAPQGSCSAVGSSSL